MGGSQPGGSGKGGGKEGKRDRAREDGERLANVQRTKDKEIANLKRQLSEMKGKGGSSGNEASGKDKRQRWGRWK